MYTEEEKTGSSGAALEYRSLDFPPHFQLFVAVMPLDTLPRMHQFLGTQKVQPGGLAHRALGDGSGEPFHRSLGTGFHSLLVNAAWSGRALHHGLWGNQPQRPRAMIM